MPGFDSYRKREENKEEKIIVKTIGAQDAEYSGIP